MRAMCAARYIGHQRAASQDLARTNLILYRASANFGQMIIVYIIAREFGGRCTDHDHMVGRLGVMCGGEPSRRVLIKRVCV